jgi:hypothetical protein
MRKLERIKRLHLKGELLRYLSGLIHLVPSIDSSYDDQNIRPNREFAQRLAMDDNVQYAALAILLLMAYPSVCKRLIKG